ncbi:MAG: glycosyltransferase family 2 protein [Acidobacteriota bacterium]|nr:glycosyltransferase family 2 protein [Acidobacteriota bacterium]
MRTGVGVVVVSHDSADDLPACLDALGSAAGVGKVVVVDNASRDGSCDVARGVGGDQVVVVEEQVNSGFAGGCNRGFKELASDFPVLAFLNPDVMVSRDCLSSCAEALEADAELAGVAPLLMRTDGDTVDSAGQVLKSANLEVRDIGYGLPPSPDLFESRPVLASCGALAVFRTSALAAVADEHGPWAQQYFCFWEDLELGWRLANNGRVVRTVPDAVATHRRGGGAAEGRGPLRWRRPAHLEACMFTNRWMTLIRHLHPLDLAPRLPLLLVWDSAAVAAGALRRPALIGHIKRRWPLVMKEWRSRSRYPRRRLRELI